MEQEYGISVTNELPNENFDSIVLAVAHDKFKDIDICSWAKDKSVIFDVKSILPKELVDGRL